MNASLRVPGVVLVVVSALSFVPLASVPAALYLRLDYGMPYTMDVATQVSLFRALATGHIVASGERPQLFP